MISDVPNDEMFLHDEINNYNTTVNSNDLKNNTIQLSVGMI